MTWRFDSVRKYDEIVPTCFCDTQFGIAVGSCNYIHILAYWGEETEFEYGVQQGDIYPHLYIAPEVVTAGISDKALGHWAPMKVVNEFTVSNDIIYEGLGPPTIRYNCAQHLVAWNNKLFVFTNNSTVNYEDADEQPFIRMVVYDLLTGEPLKERQLASTQEPFVCKPIIHKGKIWLTTKMVENNVNDTQYLVSYDATTYEIISRTAIPARKQERHHHFVAVGDWLIVDLFNDNGIAKFDATTGQHISNIFVNRKPLSMFYNGDNKLIVGSYKGMISEVDLVTETVTHITASSGEATSGIIDDGRYVWVGTEGGLSRTDKTLEEFNLISQPGSGSGAIEPISLMPEPVVEGQEEEEGEEGEEGASESGGDLREILLSQPFTYQAWINGEFVEHQRKGYILARTSKQVLAIRNVPMWREYYNEVLGTSMIATPETEYYGETE